jgi:hypothetical protein
MHSERLAYLEKLNNEQEMTTADVATLIAEVRKYETALTKIAALIDSEADDPLDDAINIATEALHCKPQN